MLHNYLVTAFRSMLSNKSHTVINVTGLALGLSGMIFIMLWVVNELSFDRFHPNAERTYRVLANYQSSEGDIQTLDEVPVLIGTNIQEQFPQIDAITRIAKIDRWPGKLCFKHAKDTVEECVYRQGIYTDENFFSTFNYPVIEGDRSPLSLMTDIAISRQMANDLFPKQNAIGKSLVIDNWIELKVASVFENVPANSSHQFDFVMSLPLFRKLRGMTNDEQWKEFSLATYVVSQQKLDASLFSQEINKPNVLRQDIAEYGISLFVQPFTEMRLYDRFENGKVSGGRISYVKIFSLVGIVVLLIACINFVHLATVRAFSRGQEIGVRKVNGANKRQLILQFLGESFVLVLVAMCLAIGIVQFALPFFNRLTGENLVFDLLVFPMPVFAALIMVLVTAASGMYPAFVLSGFNPIGALRNKVGRAGSSNTLKTSLMVLQMVASGTLIIFTSVLFMQLRLIQNKNLGYDRENIIRIEPTYNLLTKFDAFTSALKENTSIVDACAASGDLLNIPFSSDQVSWPEKNTDEKIPFRILACSYGFLESFNIELISGKGFTRERESKTIEMVLTESAVKRMGLEDPLGTTIRYYDQEAQIVGVVNDVHGQSLHHEIEPTIFVASDPKRLTAIYVKYTGDAQTALETITETYNKLEPDFSIVYWFFDDAFDKQYKREAVTGRLSLIFTVLAIGISLLGIIGLSTYNVLKRMREVGVRKVFGASSAQILLLLSKDFIKLSLVSSLLAWPVATYFTQQWLDSFAFRIAIPWYVYLVSTLSILSLTLIAVGGQAAKAVLTNPTEVLKDE